MWLFNLTNNKQKVSIESSKFKENFGITDSIMYVTTNSELLIKNREF